MVPSSFKSEHTIVLKPQWRDLECHLPLCAISHFRPSPSSLLQLWELPASLLRWLQHQLPVPAAGECRWHLHSTYVGTAHHGRVLLMRARDGTRDRRCVGCGWREKWIPPMHTCTTQMTCMFISCPLTCTGSQNILLAMIKLYTKCVLIVYKSATSFTGLYFSLIVR